MGDRAGGDPKEAETAAPSKELRTLANKARHLAMPHCGSCHGDPQHEGKKAALRIFDLREPTWFENLTAHQLRSALNRIQGKLDPTSQATFSAFIHLALERLKRTESATVTQTRFVTDRTL